MWTYRQKSGELLDADGIVLDVGYSGYGPAKKNNCVSTLRSCPFRVTGVTGITGVLYVLRVTAVPVCIPMPLFTLPFSFSLCNAVTHRERGNVSASADRDLVVEA